jgi:hypothetical protein
MVKKAPLIMLGSVVAVGGGFGLYWYLQKAKQRTITMTVTPTDITVCATTFTVSGKVLDGLGRPVAYAPVYLWLDTSKAETPMVTGPDGTYTGQWMLITGGAHISADFTRQLSMYTTVDSYSSPKTTVTVRGTACTSCA